MSISNKIQLITYPDSLGKNLKDLKLILNKYFKEVIVGLHILPFYPSSTDRGFAPKTHSEVDSQFGSWEDILNLSDDFELMADLVVNHISDQSNFFRDFVKHGYDSQYADLFLTIDKIFPDNKINLEEMSKVYTRKPKLPIREITLNSGSAVKLWNTFYDEQIDLDVNSGVTKHMFYDFIENLSNYGITMLRLDAIGYTTKKIGTRCFFEEPEIFTILAWFKEVTAKFNIEILPEVHSNYVTSLKLAKEDYYTYDFALPILILYSLIFHNSVFLKNWLKVRPKKSFTVLDTHDGIGIIDAQGLLPTEEIAKTRDAIYKNGGNDTFFATGAKSKNLDIYQINCTYYSALGEDDNAYLVARVIQFFTPGIPQIYYVGLLAGKNDHDLLHKTGNGRDINRHYYNDAEIELCLNTKVVKNLFRLMEFRNNYPAFNGEFKLFDSDDNILKLGWTKGAFHTSFTLNLETLTFEIKYFDTNLGVISNLTFLELE